jgi:hypothetical protein
MRKQGLAPLTLLYLVVVAGLALLALLVLWHANHQAGSPIALLLVALGGALSHVFPLEGRNHETYHATLPFVIVAAALFTTPELAAFIVMIHLAEQLRTHRRWYIQVFNTSGYFLAAALAGVMYRVAWHQLGTPVIGQMEAALTAGCTFVIVNRVLVAVVLWLARGVSPSQSGLFRPEMLAVDLIIIWVSGPMLALIALAGPAAVLIAAGPLFLARPALTYLLQPEAPARRRSTAHIRRSDAA